MLTETSLNFDYFQIATLAEFDFVAQLNLLKNLLSHCNRSINKRLKVNHYPYKYLTPEELTELLEKCEDVMLSKRCQSRDVFLEILSKNSLRFDSTVEDGIEGSDEYRSIHSFVNSICKPDVIEMAKANLINELS